MNCCGVHNITLFSNACCTQLSRSVFVVGLLSILPYKALIDMWKPMYCGHHHHLYQGSKLSPILDVPTSVSGFSCTRSTITLIQRERMRKGTIYVFSIIHACMILCGLSFLLKWLLASDALASAKIIGSACTCIIGTDLTSLLSLFTPFSSERLIPRSRQGYHDHDLGNWW